MCIRDRYKPAASSNAIAASATHGDTRRRVAVAAAAVGVFCLLYTSDAADERSSVDLGGRRIIKKKHNCS